MKGILRIACGLSGGVDSSVAALLLRNAGYDLTGVFMRNWKADGDETLKGVCPSSGDYEDARIVAKKLDIKFHQVDFEKEYWNLVFSEFLKEYEEGRTPNPDILCNQHVKFGAFLRYCRENLGVDAIATGHYARTNFDINDLGHLDFKAKLLKAADDRKDQTFFLSRISQAALRQTLFPLGNLQKSQVRQIAKENGLQVVADKPDSYGICFIGKRKFSEFVDQYLEPRSGSVVDIDSGAVIGTHSGFHHWTLGQRCAFGSFPQPYYIAHKHLLSQTIFVAAGHFNPALYSSGVILGRIPWISETEPEELTAKDGKLLCHFKYQQVEKAVPCDLEYCDANTLKATFIDGSLRAITPGQYGVFYLGEECLGSAKLIKGVIDHPAIIRLQNEDEEFQSKLKVNNL